MEEKFGVDAQNLVDCGWKAARPSGEAAEYMTMGLSFMEASKNAAAAGKDADARALALFAAAMSMFLRPSSTNTPFGPAMEINGRRSALPQDFSDADLKAMAGACAEIDDPWIKARFADIVWLSSKPRAVAMAEIACDAYVEIPLEPASWQHGAVTCWARAISLCRQLGRGQLQRLERIQASLLEMVRAVRPADGLFLRKIADLLHDGGLGRTSSFEIATRLQATANDLVKEGDFLIARFHFEGAATWFAKAPDAEREADCLCSVAETFVAEAETRIAIDPLGFGVASSFYENAIQAFRRVPKEKRAARDVDRRISDVHRSMKQAGEQSMEQMVSISSDEVDLTELAERAGEYVKGKTLGGALHALSMIHVDQGRQAYFKIAEEFFKSNFLHAMISVERRSPDGRVVAKRPGVSFEEVDSPKAKEALHAEAVRAFAFDIRIAAQGKIIPAYKSLLLEHRVLLSDLIELARHSPIVPPSREQLVGKALFYGFEGDFEAALHLATPQIEHIVRWQLKKSGVKTTNLDRDGIENENGLSTLTELPQFEIAFGQDLSFAIRALFCDAFGPNLRNEIAHGLMEDGAGSSLESVYAWWLLLRLVFSHFLAAQIDQASAEQGSA